MIARFRATLSEPDRAVRTGPTSRVSGRVGPWVTALMAVAGLKDCGSGLRAGTVDLPNGSFESPATGYVNPHVDFWQKTPKPPSYDESGGFLWVQLSGVFRNPDPDKADHIDDCDGIQALYLFADSQVGLFQDYESTDWNHDSPLHALTATYEVGKSYELTVGVMGGGGGMAEGIGLEISLYYRDDLGNRVTVAATTVTNTFDAFPVHTHLVDQRVQVPIVQPGDPWANRHVGVQLLSVVRSDQVEGGYWDVDPIRLSAVGPLVFAVAPVVEGAGVRLNWPSVTGYRYQTQESDNLAIWTDLGASQSGDGEVLTTLVSTDGLPGAFFRVVAAPGP